MKETADRALLSCPTVTKVIVHRRVVRDVPWTHGRDQVWEVLLEDEPDRAPTHEMDPEDPLMIIYTSGTTGKPKGTLHVHGGFPVKAAQDMAHGFDVGAEDTVFWFTDLGWMMGPWLIFGSLALGATMVLYEGTPDHPAPDRLWRMVAQHGVTVFGVSPTLVRSLMTHGDEPPSRHDLSSLRILGGTGEPWNPEPFNWFFRQIGGGRIPVINYTGGTEISGGILCGNVITRLRPCSFAGPVPGIAADVVDADGKPVRGEVGELVIRNPWPGMTRGFWGDRDRYIETYWNRFPDVWVHGDWAYIDPDDGLWYVLGRSDDTIKVAGKRLGPAEVESVLMGHPAVAESAAVGVPDELKGEALVCFVILRPGREPSDALAAELKELVAGALGKPLRPHEVHFVSDLPRTRNAKILRRVVRSVYTGADPGDLSSLENPSAWPPSRRLEAEDPVSLHRQLHQVDRRDERRVLSEHLLRDPTGLGAAFSNVEANLLRSALGEEVGQGRDADSANAGADLGLEQVDRVARERDRDLDVGRPSAVGGDVERDAGTSRVGGPGGGRR